MSGSLFFVNMVMNQVVFFWVVMLDFFCCCSSSSIFPNRINKSVDFGMHYLLCGSVLLQFDQYLVDSLFQLLSSNLNHKKTRFRY